MGKATEAAEFAEPVIRHVYRGEGIDKKNMAEELADGWWYDMVACRVLDLDPDKVMDAVIAKLMKRYPDKFTEQAALNRDTGVEMDHFTEKMEATE